MQRYGVVWRMRLAGSLSIGGVQEEAAVGAALTAAVAVGVYPDIGYASRVLVR